MQKIITKISIFPPSFWILTAIIIIGIFLRTYNFNAWLEFRGDQARDASRVDDVISGKTSWPLLGPFLFNTAATKEKFFHTGPIYYYFQIISAKIFSDAPDKLAYPDVFFAILSIPLFYFFLKIYFDRNISLALTGIYSISTYLIHYSRYAWSSNPIPFFVLLFLFTLYKFLEKNEKISWFWIILLGIALGIGFQLHAITMIVFSVMTFFVSIFSMKKNFEVWKKWSTVLLIFMIFNIPQIISEINSNFQNSKAFLGSFSQENPTNKNTNKNFFVLIKNNIDCGLESNFLYLTSHGSDLSQSNCSHTFSKTLNGKISKNSKNFFGKMSLLLASLILSGLGLFLLVINAKDEIENNKKYFLRLIILYFLVSFFVLLPLSGGKINDLRYYNFIFFAPFVLLGLIFKLIFKKIGIPLAVSLAATILILVVISDFKAASAEVATMQKGEATCSGSTTLGELEPVVRYIKEKSNQESKIYLGGSQDLWPALDSLEYLMKKQHINFEKSYFDIENPLNNRPSFYINCSERKKLAPANSYQKIGNFYVYQIKN